jgi:MFS transporter, OFA family, oxalate/formate antiporter
MATSRSGAASATASNTTGWIVTFAGTGINLALGILYTWSVIKQFVPEAWGWTETDKSIPYSVALLAFAFATIPAGRLQDTIGPRTVAAVGGVMVAAGMVLASFFSVPLAWLLFFGVLTGAGIGFGYASATPPAVKWFNKKTTGLIAGIVVAGFGLASVYAAPTAQWLGTSYGLQRMVLIFGIAFLVVVVGLAQLLKPPPAGYVAPGEAPAPTTAAGIAAAAAADYGPGEMLRTPQFYLLWAMYAVGAGVGLMVISQMAKIATDAGLALGFVLVVLLAIGNGAGRILAGMLSDRIGRTNTMLLVFVLQAILILLLTLTVKDSIFASVFVLGLMAALIGGNYGANLSVFPAVTRDWFGTKNFGVNYGLVFSSWGVGGLVLSLIAGAAYDATKASTGVGSFNLAFYIAAGLLVLAAIGTFVIKAPKPRT